MVRKPPAWPADAVTRTKIADLIPYARNARTHSDAQIEQLVASIREWGWTMPILVDEAGGIIAGHGRVLAAESMGLKDVPTMTARGWSETKRRAYAIADNKLALNAGWDDEILVAEFADLKLADFDLGLIGFDLGELAEILSGFNFAPGSEGEQGRLDKATPIIVVCPKCSESFDARQHGEG